MTNKAFLYVCRLSIIMVLALLLAGCAAGQKKNDPRLPVQEARLPVSDVVEPDKDYTIDAYDPWKSFNVRMYRFNYHFDRYVFLPVVQAYETVMPDFLEDCVTNFFKNVDELRTLLNAILQLKMTSTARTTERLVVNTTFGIGGLFDVATLQGIPRQNEDFGQTLGHYSMGPGPYLVLPVLGPSSARDTFGFAVDSAVRMAIYNAIDPLENASEKDAIELGISALEAIDKRHQIGFRYYETGSPFEYDLVRMIYLKKRELDVAK